MRKPITIAVIVVFLLAALTPPSYWGLRTLYSKAEILYERVRDIRADAESARAAALWVKHSTYLSSHSTDEAAPAGAAFVFVGHTYGFNGCGDPGCEYGGPSFEDAVTPMDLFVESAMAFRPSRVVFGGDTLWNPTAGGLTYLRDTLAPRFDGVARFIPGNHDDVRTGGAIPGGLVRSVFPEPYYYEDVGGVRLVYLRSVLPAGEGGNEAGLDASQLQFLTTTLEDPSYDMALVFLHHGLWLADEPVQYANRDYGVAHGALPKGFWATQVLPLLEQGRVGAVLSGDGGVMQPTVVTQLCGISHYLSGWDLDLQRRPAEFLEIVVDERHQVHVLRYVMFDDQLYQLPAKLVGLQEPPVCSSE